MAERSFAAAYVCRKRPSRWPLAFGTDSTRPSPTDHELAYDGMPASDATVMGRLFAFPKRQLC